MPLAPRIALNATPVLSPLTGIGTYVVELGAALARSGADLYSFYGHNWRHEAPTAPPPGKANAIASNLRAWARDWLPLKRTLRDAQRRIAFGAGLRRHRVALYHEPNYVPLCYDVPVVVTIHDLSWLRHPETHPADRVRWLARGVHRAVERARAIVVDSAFVAQEVTSTFGVAPGRVHVAHLGVSPRFHRRDAAETAARLRTYALEHGRYLLSVGTLEPRKNIGHVLAAYALLPSTVRERYPLVIAGAPGWKAGALENDLHALNRRAEIRFLGYVPPDDLPFLYAGAAAFVYPSLYEGFGLPPLEAMASGVPVLVANRSALPEVVGDAGVFIDPVDPPGTAAALRSILEDPQRRAQLGERGAARAGAFTWQRCAQATLLAYADALQ